MRSNLTTTRLILIFVVAMVTFPTTLVAQTFQPSKNGSSFADMPETFPGQIFSQHKPLKIGPVTSSADQVSRYEKLELTVELDATYENPFDPAEVRLDAIFTSPSGQEQIVPGFFLVEHRREVHTGSEVLLPEGHGAWKIRFAPRETGRYSWRLTTWVFASLARTHYDAQVAAHLAVANGKGWNSSVLEAILRNTSLFLLRRNLALDANNQPRDGRYIEVLTHVRTSERVKTPYGLRVISQADGSLLPGHSGVYCFGGSWFLNDAANYLLAGVHGLPTAEVDALLAERIAREIVHVPAFNESISTVTGQPHETNRNTLIEPNCNGSLLRMDYEQAGEKKRMLLFANPHSQKARTHHTIQVSFDDGRTWPKEHHLLLDEGHGAGYPSLTRIDDRHVGIVYEGSQAHLVFEKLSLVELLGR